MNDERREESAALYALDLLEGPERSAFEAELQQHPALRQLVDELRESSHQLAFAAPPAEPSPFLRERLLASVAAAPRQMARPAGRTGARSASFAWAAAAAFAVLAGYLGWHTQRLQGELDQQRAAVASAGAEAEQRFSSARAEVDVWRERLERERAEATAVIAELRRQTDVAELKVASLASLLGNSPAAEAIAVWNPLTQEGMLTVVNLPALEANKDYQLWLIDPQYPIPVDGGVFRVDPATGEARVTFKPDRPVKVVEKFAVSLERAGGVPKAEGPMVLLSE